MTRPGGYQDGDTLFERVLAGENGELGYELLKAFFRGYPLDRLRLLLRSDVDNAVKTGAFIASELAADAKPLLDDIVPLLDHRLTWVRADALDAILTTTSEQDADAVAKAVMLIFDHEEGVRWCALMFLAKASEEQLVAAQSVISDDEIKRRLGWLLSGENTLDHVISCLKGDRLDRMFAAAAAARLSSDRLIALRVAAASEDPEVSTYARDELDIISGAAADFPEEN